MSVLAPAFPFDVVVADCLFDPRFRPQAVRGVSGDLKVVLLRRLVVRVETPPIPELAEFGATLEVVLERVGAPDDASGVPRPDATAPLRVGGPGDYRVRWAATIRSPTTTNSVLVASPDAPQFVTIAESKDEIRLRLTPSAAVVKAAVEFLRRRAQ